MNASAKLFYRRKIYDAQGTDALFVGMPQDGEYPLRRYTKVASVETDETAPDRFGGLVRNIGYRQGPQYALKQLLLCRGGLF